MLTTAEKVLTKGGICGRTGANDGRRGRGRGGPRECCGGCVSPKTGELEIAEAGDCYGGRVREDLVSGVGNGKPVAMNNVTRGSD